jgi:hypothetical protein
MTTPLAPPPGVDVLAQAIEYIRPQLDPARSIHERVRVFWAAVASARNLSASDVVHNEFLFLAIDAGLAADLSQHPPYAAEEALAHLIKCGLAARDPFGRRRDGHGD